MDRSNLSRKYSNPLPNRPPSGLRRDSRTMTGGLADDNGDDGDVGNRTAEENVHDADFAPGPHGSRPGSRNCTPREDRVGLVNQYRKPWIRPMSTNNVSSLNERRRQMEVYRSGRPKSSPALRRHSPPRRAKSEYPSSRSPSRFGSRPSLLSRSNTSLYRRRESVIDSDVEEIVADAISKCIPSLSGSTEQIVSTTVDVGQTCNNGWTQEDRPDSESPTEDRPPSETAMEEKRIPVLSSRPRMHVTVEDHSDQDSEESVKEDDDEKAQSDSPDESPNQSIEVEVEHQNEITDVDDHDRRKSSVLTVNADDYRSRRNSRSVVVDVDGRRRSRPPSPAGETMVRRSRKERLRRLTHYKVGICRNFVCEVTSTTTLTWYFKKIIQNRHKMLKSNVLKIMYIII